MPLINKCPSKSGIKINGSAESYPQGEYPFLKGDFMNVDVDIFSSPKPTTLCSCGKASPYYHDVKCIELTDGHIMAVYTNYNGSSSATYLNVLEVDENNNFTSVAQKTIIRGEQYAFEMVSLTNNRALIFYIDTLESNGGIIALIASYSNGAISTTETNFSTESIYKTSRNFRLIHLSDDKYLLLYSSASRGGIMAMKLQITSDGAINVLISGIHVMGGTGIAAAERLSDTRVFIAGGSSLGSTSTDSSTTYWRTVVSVGENNISALPQTNFSNYQYGITNYAGGVIAIDSNKLLVVPCRSEISPMILTVSGEEIVETIVPQSVPFGGSTIYRRLVFCTTTHGNYRLIFYTNNSDLYLAHVLPTAANGLFLVSKINSPFSDTGNSQSSYGGCLTATGKVILVFPTNSSTMKINSCVAAEIKAVPNYYEHYGMVTSDAVSGKDLQITSIGKEGE